MKTFFTALFLCFLGAGYAQTSADEVVPITVTTSTAPSITLSWPAPAAGVSEVYVLRKQIFETAWTLLDSLPANATSFTDVGVGTGQANEYMLLQRGGTPAQRIGLAYAGIDLPAYTGSRGKIVLVIDDALSAPLSGELARLEQDLRGDGWQVLRHDIPVASNSVASVKTLIRTDWEADPNTLCVLLFGNIPVPYSGDIAPDGHTDHIGAWPTDYYYGDFDEELWTDADVNDPAASRPANRNVPGDGKFDQSLTPSLPEVVVSRVDFSNLNGWNESQTELYRRYLNKNHAFRTGAYKPANKTLVDDNFGYFGGEAFAQNGWRNGAAISGPANVQEGDFFNDTDNESFLFGYGCGAGSYTSAAGVGTSDNFKTDSVNIVFSMLFGSYHGDWDYESNPLMPSALASKGGILTCTWAGRPNWHFHHMALGEPIWVSAYWEWLNSFLTYRVYPPSGINVAFDELVHVGMLGDPTLRAHAVVPPTSVVASPGCSNIQLSWTASADASLGYYVYRASSLDSVFQLLTTNPVSGTSFNDTDPLDGINFYQVKSLKKEVVPTGSYFNQSIGAPAQASFNGLPAVSVTTTPTSCNGGFDGTLSISASGGTPGYSYLWSLGYTTSAITNAAAGNYLVTVTDQLGCSVTATATVSQPSALQVQAASTNVSCNGAADGSIQLTVTGGTPPYTAEWSNDDSGVIINGLSAGVYSYTVTDANGCTKVGSRTITQTAPLNAQASVMNASCFGGTGGILLNIFGGAGSYVVDWADLPGANNPVSRSNLPAGTYQVTVTDANGCTTATSAQITQPSAINIQFAVTNVACAPALLGSIDMTVTGGSGLYTFFWSNGSTASSLTNLAAGAYTVTVADSYGCTKTSTATVGQNTSINIQFATVAASCFGDSNGMASATVTGGMPPYTYHWSNGATTLTLNNVPAGAYTLSVTDASNCVVTGSANVTQPPALNLTFSSYPVSCHGGQNGAIDLTVAGGTAPYTYLWENNVTTQDVNNLWADTFDGTVTDANGCTAVISVTIQEPPALTLSLDAASPTCANGNNGVILAQPEGGTPGYVYQWSNNFGTPAIGNLPSGFYTCTVTDANGCTVVMSAVLDEPLLVTFQMDIPPILCFGDETILQLTDVSGGNGGPYAYSLDNGVPLSTDFGSAIVAGYHLITLYDATGCHNDMNFFVEQPSAILSAIETTNASCIAASDGALEAGATGGTSPYTYLWETGETTAGITGLPFGDYLLTITDANGCTIETIAYVLAPTPVDVPIVGSDTACASFPETYSMPPDFLNYHWILGPDGFVNSGQGTNEIVITWTDPGLHQLKVAFELVEGCPDTSSLSLWAEICLDAKEPSFASAMLSPNPFTDALFLRFGQAPPRAATLQVSDAQGRILLKQTCSDAEVRLDTADWPAGAYFIRLSDPQGARVWKAVKVE